MKFSREITLGNILSIIVYTIVGLFFIARLSAGIDNMKESLRGLKTDVQRLENRIDFHIDQTRK